MNEEFKYSVFYPEFFTHKSLRLNSAPESGDNPPSGYIYMWESFNDGKLLISIRTDDGSNYVFTLTDQKPSNPDKEIVIPDQLEPFVWDSTNIDSTIVSGKKYLVIPHTYTIAEVCVYKTESKNSTLNVSCSLYNDGQGNILIDLTDFPTNYYQYGGIVKFAQGTIVNFNNEDEIPFLIPTAGGTVTIDANNSLHQVIGATTQDLILTSSDIKNLTSNQCLKLRIHNDGDVKYNITINGEPVSTNYSVFYVMFMSINGIVKQLGKVVRVN